MALLKRIRHKHFKRSLQVVDDLDLLDLRVAIEATIDSTPSSTLAELSTGKRPAIEERET